MKWNVAFEIDSTTIRPLFKGRIDSRETLFLDDSQASFFPPLAKRKRSWISWLDVEHIVGVSRIGEISPNTRNNSPMMYRS